MKSLDTLIKKVLILEKATVEANFKRRKYQLMVVGLKAKQFKTNLISRGWMEKLKFGIPLKIIAANGPPFSSESLKEFCHTMGIQLILTAPYAPTSNEKIYSNSNKIGA